MTMQRLGINTRFFSVKVKNKRDAPTRRSLRAIRNCNMQSNKSQNGVESHDELIEKKEETLEEFEEEKRREESMAQNLKLIKKQKTRLARLQKILSRNVILIPLCAICMVLSAASLIVSTSTDYYQYVTYDIDILKANIELQNNFSYEKIAELMNKTVVPEMSTEKSTQNRIVTIKANVQQKSPKSTKKSTKKPGAYFFGKDIGIHSVIEHKNERKASENHVNDGVDADENDVYVFELKQVDGLNIIYRNNYFKPNSSSKIYPVYSGYSGVWRTCNYLTEKELNTLNIKNCNFFPSLSNFVRNKQRAKSYLTDEYLDHLSYNHGRDLIRMYNVSACCVIVAYLMLISSWITALSAILSKSVPVTIITSVLNSMISLFMVLLLAIIHRKIYMQQSHDCLDVNRDTFGLVVCSSRTFTFGWSLGLAWIVVLISALNSLCWFHIAKMQKLLFTHGYYYN